MSTGSTAPCRPPGPCIRAISSSDASTSPSPDPYTKKPRSAMSSLTIPIWRTSACSTVKRPTIFSTSAMNMANARYRPLFHQRDKAVLDPRLRRRHLRFRILALPEEVLQLGPSPLSQHHMMIPAKRITALDSGLFPQLVQQPETFLRLYRP